MSEARKSILSDILLGLAAMTLVCFINWNQGHSIVHLLCDGFFVAAVLLLGSGGLMFCRNHGAMDMIGYGFQSLIHLFSTPGRLDGPEEDYFTYCQRKAEERKPYGHFLISGLVYLVLSVICFVIYQSMK